MEIPLLPLLLPLQPLLCGRGWRGDGFSGRVRAGVVTNGRRLQWVVAVTVYW